jgi:hypothetical protein
VNGQFTSKGGTVATASDDQPDFGKITVTNGDSSPFVTKINDLPKSAGILLRPRDGYNPLGMQMTLTPEAERLQRQILELEKLEVLLNEFAARHKPLSRLRATEPPPPTPEEPVPANPRK